MVIYKCNLTKNELIHYLNCSVLLDRVDLDSVHLKKQQIIDSVKVPLNLNYTFQAGYKFGSYFKKYREIVINNKVLRVFLEKEQNPNNLNGVFSHKNYKQTPRKSILKNYRNETPKSVKFDEYVTVTPISPRKSTDCSSSDDSEVFCNSFVINGDRTPVSRTTKTRKRSLTPLFKNGELKITKKPSNKKINPFYNKQLQTTKMTTEEDVKLKEDDQKENIEAEVVNKTENGESQKTTTNKIVEITPQLIKYEVKIVEKMKPKPDFESVEEFLVTPKRKRGRPRKNHLDPDPPFSPFGTPKKKPCITPKKPTTLDSTEPKRKRGRPRKNREFGYHSICAEVDNVALPSELWSATVSVPSKKSQTTFMRVVEDEVSIRCDRSVKFMGGKNYYIKINKRFVELVGAPKTVESLREIEILLEIVNDLEINDPILRYYVR